jgi:hypothetical protein
LDLDPHLHKVSADPKHCRYLPLSSCIFVPPEKENELKEHRDEWRGLRLLLVSITVYKKNSLLLDGFLCPLAYGTGTVLGRGIGS